MLYLISMGGRETLEFAGSFGLARGLGLRNFSSISNVGYSGVLEL